ncbi:MAG: hypothetical protein AB1730_00570 [Myxococcota bacterium]
MSLEAPDFAQVAVEYIKSQGERRPVTVDAARDRLVLGEPPGPVSFLFLGHARREYDAAPAGEQERVLARRFWSSIDAPASGDPGRVLRGVFPRVRDRAWFSALRRQAELELGADEGAIDEVMLPHRVLNDDLAVHLAWELPTSMMELGPDRLDAWGVSFEAAFSQAKANLKARSTRAFDMPAPGLYVSPYHDGLDATRMVLPELFEGLEVKGLPVVLAPTHDILFVTGDEDEKGLTQVAAWAEEALLEPRAHSAVAFRLEEGAWKSWMPEKRHPAWGKLKLLALQTLASAYARQKEVLEALLEANGHELFVGTMRAFRGPSGDIFTASAWTEGVEALLPRTDRIDFVRLGPTGGATGGQVWSTTFEVALETVGDLMEPSGDWPERYRVRGFPTLQQLEAMAQAGKL